MTSLGVPADTASASGLLLVLSIFVPLAAGLIGFAAGGRRLEWIALGTTPIGIAIAVAVFLAVRGKAAPLVYVLGGWAPPLGVALRADWLAAVMMVMTAGVISAIAIFAFEDFRLPKGASEARAPFAFWILLLAIWGALNLAFVGGDLFTLYVALELLTFAAVPLVCLKGERHAVQAALRYLIFALLGSIFYLLGAALFYSAYGTLDLAILSERFRPELAPLIAMAAMTAGLLAKTALFPLHLWLPPAHASAPTPASALLSALVVKGSFFITVRLWFGIAPGLLVSGAAQLLGVLGAAAILFGSVMALRQERLKLLIAYSTLAQIGYLFLMFPLASGGPALTGGIVQAISHATAKAAMFMSAGLVFAALGHDRIAGLGGLVRTSPLSLIVFALSGLALTGLFPSGAYVAKSLLLRASNGAGPVWTLVIQAGGFLTSSYVIFVIAHAFASPVERGKPSAAPSRLQITVAMVLALSSILLGFLPWPGYESSPPGPSDLAVAALTLAGGAAIAIVLGRWDASVARTVPSARFVSIAFEQIDRTMRQWPVAALSFVALAVLFGVVLIASR